MENNVWLSVEHHIMPPETQLLVAHKFGVEAIHFWSAEWKYWYTGKTVGMEVLSTITHFMIPINPNTNGK